MTDRPNPKQSELSQPQTEEILAKPSPMTIEPTPGPSNEKMSLNQNEPCPETSKLVTPEQIRPFPKAAPRKMATRRKVGKSLILTNTPIKESLEEEAKNREEKKKKQQKVNITKRQAATKRILESSSSSAEENISYHESSDSPEDFDDYNEISSDVSEGDYIIVKVFGKTAMNFRHYVAKVSKTMHNGYDVTFLKRFNLTNKFIDENEIGFVSKEDVVLKSQPPLKSSCALFTNMISFSINFSDLHFTVF